MPVQKTFSGPVVKLLMDGSFVFWEPVFSILKADLDDPYRLMMWEPHSGGPRGTHSGSLLPFTYGTFHITIRLIGLEFLTLIGKGLPLTEGNLDLGKSPAVEKYPQWDQREALLVQFHLDFMEFAAMNQQFTGRDRLMVGDIAVVILGNITPDQKELAVANPAESFIQRRLALAKAFDLGAHEHHAGFQLFKNMVVETRLFIVDSRAVGGRFIIFFIFRFLTHTCILANKIK